MNSNSPHPSGMTVPIWYQDPDGVRDQPVQQNLRAEICVVGAGIAGLTTAYLLAKAGKKVVVVDEKPVGGGESGRTSAHLASAIDDRFTQIEKMHGVEAASLHYRSHATAIDLIEAIDRQEQLCSEFARVDGYLFLAQGQEIRVLQDELAAAQRAGVRDVGLQEGPLKEGSTPRPCLCFPRQARFHPLLYLRGLAGVLRKMGVSIYCGDRVMDLRGNGPVVARLRSGLEVTADFGVSATNIPTPINNWAGIYTKQASYRTYMVGLEVAGDDIADALYWDFADPYHYARLHQAGGRRMLLVGGEDHKTGQGGDATDRFARLHSWAQSCFPGVGPIVSQWSGQVNEPDDGVAFIGKVPTKDHAACYVITGDSGMGLTHATLGAVLIKDLIVAGSSEWASLYEPSRKPFHSIASAGTFAQENANALAQMADHVTAGDVASADQIPPGSGAVMRSGPHKLAVYRDPAGALHTCSAICPHLKCVVHWNQVERSWDCPCHGSRFDAKGGLINGPSIDDLPSRP